MERFRRVLPPALLAILFLQFNAPVASACVVAMEGAAAETQPLWRDGWELTGLISFFGLLALFLTLPSCLLALMRFRDVVFWAPVSALILGAICAIEFVALKSFQVPHPTFIDLAIVGIGPFCVAVFCVLNCWRSFRPLAFAGMNFLLLGLFVYTSLVTILP